MSTVGNVYSETGWYTPTKYPNRKGSDWATGKNTVPDAYTESELTTHYDMCYNDPHPKMRPNKALPADANSIRYDWVVNIRSGEGRWAVHNPNGLNAAVSPYEWDDKWSRTMSTRAVQTREVSYNVQNESFDAKFEAELEKRNNTVAAAPRSENATAASANPTLANLSRNVVLQNQFQQLAAAGVTKALTYGTLLDMDKDDKDGKNEGNDANRNVSL